MVLNGDLADLLIRFALTLYNPFETKDAIGRKFLYLYRLQKTVYGLMRDVLLFYYRKSRGDLEVYGFVITPMDHAWRI